MRTPTISGTEREGLAITQEESGFQGIGSIASFLPRESIGLTSGEIETCLGIMMWDIYDEMRPETNKTCRDLLKKFQDNGDVATGLLEAIALLNVERYLLDGGKIENLKGVKFAYELFFDDRGIELKKYMDLFYQMNTYRGDGKLQPPELQTILSVEEARITSKDAVRNLLM